MELKLQMSRNALCPCHSGKKYKACCMGSLNDIQEQYYAFLNKQRIIKDKLITWVMSNLTEDELDGYAHTFDGRRYEDYIETDEMISFLDWLFLEARKDGKHFLQNILDNSPEIFDPVESSIAMEYINNTSGGVFEVMGIYPDEWKFKLKEIFTGTEYEVIDRLASQNFIKGDILYGRLQQIFSKYYLSGVGSLIPMNQLGHLKSFIDTKMNEIRKDNPEIAYEDFIRQHGNVINEFEPVLPGLLNSAGHKMCLSEIEYAFDIEKIDDILELFSDEKKYIIAEMDYPQKGFNSAEIAIISPHKTLPGGEGCLVTSASYISLDGEKIDTEGSITIKRNKLKIFTDSMERAEKIKRVIENTGHFKIEDESYLSGEDAIRKAEEMKEPKKPRRVTRIEKEFLGGYYIDWCRQKIPALGNISPKQAIKTEEGKEKLKKLLMEFENDEGHRRKDGEKFISAVEIIRKELDFYEN